MSGTSKKWCSHSLHIFMDRITRIKCDVKESELCRNIENLAGYSDYQLFTI